MKNILLLLALVISTQYSNAMSCTGSQLTSAEQGLQESIQKANAGISSQADTLMAEKYVLEIKRCMDSSDLSVYEALIKNLLTRYNITENQYNSGVATNEALAILKNEKEMQSKTCSALLQPAIEARYNNGVATSKDLKLIQSICNSLK